MKELLLSTIESRNIDYVYSGNMLDKAPCVCCVGHLRGDFGRSGDEFWTSFWDHSDSLKTKSFVDEFQEVVTDLHQPGHILHDYRTMIRLSSSGRIIANDTTGWQFSTEKYAYFLRCIARRGDYNFYLYAYNKVMVDYSLIYYIVERAERMGIAIGDRPTRLMDIEHARAQFNLRLDDFLAADNLDFVHDFTGIQTHMDRNTCRVIDCFVPRFAGRKGASNEI